MTPRIIALGSTQQKNRIGRAFSLWLTAREAGIDFTYFCVDDGPMWEPLRDHQEFLSDVRTVRSGGELEQAVEDAATPGTVLLVCKPRPELLRLALRLRARVPVIVDIDDPELLDPWHGASYVLRAKRIAKLGPSQFRFGWARRTVRHLNVITSNPMLQQIYGGVVVPHVREVASLPAAAREHRGPFTIGFIGTPREHKGLDDIRAATAHLARTRDVRLCVTAPAPADARPWEEWRGETSLADGRKLLEQCDAVPILSRAGVWGDLQLPAKLVDAMAAGVPAVITGRAPMVWAAGGAAVVVRDDAVSDVQDAFAMLADDAALASALADAALRRAREMFSPAAAAPNLAFAIRDAHR